MKRALLLSALVAAFFLGAASHRIFAHSHTEVTATRLFTGADNLSHFDRLPIQFHPVKTGLAREDSDPIPARSAFLVRVAPGYFENWHNANQRRYIAVLSGHAEIEVANGQKISLAPGDLALAEDLTGKGHIFRVTGNEDWVALFVDFQ
ncbi:MAG TPA: cupin domain-containing protein [Candidatus Koribacter sp.]|jgi:hypothetical protein